MVYNITNITNSVNIYQQATAINDLSNDLFATMLLLTLFLILVFSLKHNSTRTAILAASLITSFIGILFFTLQFIGWTILVAPILIFFAIMISYIFIP